jgi:hypothetical protein
MDLRIILDRLLKEVGGGWTYCVKCQEVRGLFVDDIVENPVCENAKDFMSRQAHCTICNHKDEINTFTLTEKWGAVIRVVDNCFKGSPLSEEKGRRDIDEFLNQQRDNNLRSVFT